MRKMIKKRERQVHGSFIWGFIAYQVKTFFEQEQSMVHDFMKEFMWEGIVEKYRTQVVGRDKVSGKEKDENKN